MSLAKKSRAVTCREDLSKGDTVYVVVRLDAEGKLKKRKEARVIDVLRKAAVLDIEGETQTRTVRFSELEKEVPEPPPAPPKPKKTKLRAVPDPEPERAVEPEPEGEPEQPVEPQPEPPPAPKSDAPPSIDDWVAQGTKLQERLIQEAHEVENVAAKIESEAYELQRQAEVKLEEAMKHREKLQALRKRIELLDTLRTGLDE